MYPISIPVLLNIKTNNKKFRETFSIFVRLENWLGRDGSCWDLSDEKAHGVIVFLRLLMILSYLTSLGFGKLWFFKNFPKSLFGIGFCRENLPDILYSLNFLLKTKLTEPWNSVVLTLIIAQPNFWIAFTIICFAVFASLPYWVNFAMVSSSQNLREKSFKYRGYEHFIKQVEGWVRYENFRLSSNFFELWDNL